MRLVIYPDMMKAKYIKRWRGPDGRWQYQYAKPGANTGRPKADERPKKNELRSGIEQRTGPKINQKERRLLSSAVNEAVSESYYSEIPLDDIDDNLRQRGFLLLQEDDTPWSGMLLGREGSALIPIGRLNQTKDVGGETGYQPIENAAISLSWYKDDKRRDSKYDVVAYLS